ncbi:peroxidase 20 [Rhodamnia argentea]|uniref:Peroxidase n=1 Tax=Rhodamnia argentea TaxID=178133 RepID=A0A8B8NQS9_9MYRT|nr:peroxidase 20 [Rhodamnia argentea]
MGVFLSVLLVLSLYGVGTPSGDGALVLGYYQENCPLLEEIVRHSVERAVYRDPRMAASLLRLHFHDCFVMGCDASVLLDSFDGMVSEKQALPNLNSLRGFEVIDEIKYNLEEACPYTVSCADILAIVARDAVELRGGPRWEVWLGRRDSLKASFDGANKFIPAPNSSLDTLIENFRQQGLDEGDLVALSGSHTMGKARCLSFRQGIYEESTERRHDHFQRYTTFYDILRSICPETGSDDRLAPLDHVTPFEFDNHYFLNILRGRGLLPSDNALINEDHEGVVLRHVWTYAADSESFYRAFANSVMKMGSINVLAESEGEIRRKCRFINT